LLLSITALKAVVLFGLSFYLLNKWHHQEKKYFTDSPFLFFLAVIFYAGTKVYDIILYSIFQDTPNIGESSSSMGLLLSKIRFIFSPVFSLLPYLILMLIIWFEGKKKLQWIIGGTWFITCLLAFTFASNYNQLIQFNAYAAFPPILLAIITFFIINHQRRLPQINSLILGIGWLAFAITQIIHPIWIKLGTGTWGLSWVGELLEMGAFLIIFIGFIKPASYSKNLILKAPKSDKKQLKSIKDIETLEIPQ
jgi:hypothetical protein